MTVANADTDNTFINSSAVDAGTIPGGSELRLDVDAVAGGVTGPVTVHIDFTIVYTRDMLVAI